MDKDFVIFQCGKSQYLQALNQEIKVEKLEGKKGDKIDFDKVLLISKKGKLSLGNPYLDTKVTVEILDQIRDKKISVTIFKAKSRYRRNRGHRQHKTLIKIIKF